MTGGWDREVRLWTLRGDCSPTKADLEFNGHKHWVRCVLEIMPVAGDGVWIASGSVDKTIRIWEVAETEADSGKGKHVARLEGHESGVVSMCSWQGYVS